MRLWHKDLIPYLPKKQLLAQWRECCAICSNIANKGTPNHLLVNKVLKYSFLHFNHYIQDVRNETPAENKGEVFKNWHNERYLKQCLFNLQEKYDCGGISEGEWKKIEEKFGGVFGMKNYIIGFIAGVIITTISAILMLI